MSINDDIWLVQLDKDHCIGTFSLDSFKDFGIGSVLISYAYIVIKISCISIYIDTEQSVLCKNHLCCPCVYTLVELHNKHASHERL